MAYKYTTKQGDTVDYIAWQAYGSLAGHVVERLLDANRGLADRGPILPAGLKITLPDAPEPEQENGVRLWD